MGGGAMRERDSSSNEERGIRRRWSQSELHLLRMTLSAWLLLSRSRMAPPPSEGQKVHTPPSLTAVIGLAPLKVTSPLHRTAACYARLVLLSEEHQIRSPPSTPTPSSSLLEPLKTTLHHGSSEPDISNFDRLASTDANYVYAFWRLPSVRHCYIANAVLRKHSSLLYDPKLVKGKRRTDRVCPTLATKLQVVRQQFAYRSAVIYNRANRELNIYPRSSINCKRVLDNWLCNLTYEEMENLVKT
ncbi:hypothetical protein B5X24_HaOG216476 [Helicoverpa armigera]|nr:hypothetical protein B5X24_HaOG216476 [Helicoverpa armigera]